MALALALWALLYATKALPHENLASIGAVASVIYSTRSELLSAVGITVEATLLGLAIGTLLGLVLGLAVGLSRWADALTGMIVRIMRPMPSLALIPVAILIAGLGLRMTAGLAAFAAFWPVFINARYAAHQREGRLIDTARMLGFGRLSMLTELTLPSVAPFVLTGVRIALTTSLVVTVSVEMVAGTGGLGGYVFIAEQSSAVARMYGGIIVGAALGWLLNLMLARLSGLLCPWDAATRQEAGSR